MEQAQAPLLTLVDAGNLIRERRGSWAWFRLDTQVLGDIRSSLA